MEFAAQIKHKKQQVLTLRTFPLITNSWHRKKYNLSTGLSEVNDLKKQSLKKKIQTSTPEEWISNWWGISSWFSSHMSSFVAGHALEDWHQELQRSCVAISAAGGNHFSYLVPQSPLDSKVWQSPGLDEESGNECYHIPQMSLEQNQHPQVS